MFGRRRRGRHEATPSGHDDWTSDLDSDVDLAAEDGGLDEPGPFDEGAAPDDGIPRLDLGSVRVPMPDGAQLQVEVDPEGPVRAVHLVTEIGRITVSAFAAPKTSGLWNDVGKELAEQLRTDGARVTWDRGVWGPELVATSPEVALRFVGVDGPRWLLRAVGAGPSEAADRLAALLRDIVRNTVVVRGVDPLPVRSPLPVELPEELALHLQHAQEQQAQA